MDGDRGSSWLRGAFARLPNRATVELDDDGKVARQESKPDGDVDVDTGAGAGGGGIANPPRPKFSDVLRSQVFGVSPDDVRRNRERR